MKEKEKKLRDFPSGPVAKTPYSQSQYRGPGLIPCQGTKSHVLQHVGPGVAKINKYFFKKEVNMESRKQVIQHKKGEREVSG